MLKKWLVVVFFVFYLAGLAGCGVKSNPEAEQAAQASAQAWLGLVDQAQYAQSWATASEYFKTRVQSAAWQETLRAAREPLGKLLSREFLTCHYAISLPGAPDGAYVVIQYQASFENKKTATETITPMLDPDGQWRVSGYFIK